jgi:hypothetical protein
MTEHIRRIIEEHPSQHGGRTGRHVDHDPASRDYPAAETAATTWQTRLWTRLVAIFDQGNIGDCTAEAICGAVSTRPFGRHMRSQRTCRRVYHAETLIDGLGAAWPPNDRGSSGLAACKIALQRDWISRYDHAFTLNAALSALQAGPVITGVPWMDSFDRPNPNGLCTWTPGAQVRGGHEVCVVGIDVTARTVRFANSWGPDWGFHGYGQWTWDTWERLLADQGDVTVPIR